MPNETLYDRMEALAKSHARGDELRAAAAALRAEAEAGEEFSARRLLGAWARARKLWCSITGEPLV